MRDVAFIKDDPGILEVGFQVEGECSGGRLLLQKTIQLFLEPSGFLRSASAGMTWLVNGVPSATSDERMMNELALVATGVQSTLEANMPENASLSERPASIKVVNASVEGDSMTADIEVKTMGGEVLTAVVPFKE